MKPKTPTKRTYTKKTKDDTASPRVNIAGMDGHDLVSMINGRISESITFWNGKPYNLEKVSKENAKIYLGEQTDDDDGGKTLDNRIFSAIRTVVPFATTRITEPEVYPSGNSVEAKKFAEDFEKALHIKADMEKLNMKIKFAIEDAIIRRRGYLKPRYDATTKNFCSIEYVPAESIVVDHKAKSYEELKYFRHYLEKSVEDLLLMFPEMKTAIYDAFKVVNDKDFKKLREVHTINEDWTFISNNGELDLIVCWNYKELAMGAIQDPNWNYEGENFISAHMMPLIEFNVLSDGRTHIDRTSFVEQAKFSQRTIDRRGKQIDDNASLGNVGMPVIDSEALSDDEAQYVRFEGDTVLELSIPEGKTINDVFTTWKAGTLSADVYKDKLDAIEAVGNAFGASNISQGAESGNNTLGQDELLRDQSNGRQKEIVDAIDAGTERLYQLMAQFMLVYGDEEEMFRFSGENSEFDYIILNTEQLDTKAMIRIKSGTSMPIDNAQRRATAKESANMKMIDPLSYWEIMDQPNAQKYSKRLMDFMADPAAFLGDVDEELFDRDAYSDIELIKQGKMPDYRKDLSKKYFDYLNQWIQKGGMDDPELAEEIKQSMMMFIDNQLLRGQKMLGMAETQLPTEGDINAANANAEADQAAAVAPEPGIPGEKAPTASKAKPAPAKPPM